MIIPVAEIDPKLTEICLAAQPDVLRAQVWEEEGRLIALVTVLEGSRTSQRQLKNACRTELGVPYTPVALNLIQAKRRAA